MEAVADYEIEVPRHFVTVMGIKICESHAALLADGRIQQHLGID
jgi:hypothetical protein